MKIVLAVGLLAIMITAGFVLITNNDGAKQIPQPGLIYETKTSWSSVNDTAKQIPQQTEPQTTDQVAVTKKSLTDEELNKLSVWTKGHEKYYANLDRFNDRLLEDTDRGIWYIALTLDTQNQFDEFCKNAKKVYELNDEQERQIGIDTSEKSGFYNDMYIEICVYNKIELWNLGKELSHVSQGNKPLDEDILKTVTNMALQNKQSTKSYAEMSSNYCTALRQWINEYQNSEWLSHDAQIEYNKVCS